MKHCKTILNRQNHPPFPAAFLFGKKSYAHRGVEGFLRQFPSILAAAEGHDLKGVARGGHLFMEISRGNPMDIN